MIIEAEFSPGMTLAECEEVARLAEEAGFDRLGVSDVVLWPDTFVVQALCARATSRVQIGAMVTNPYSRHPAVTAAAVKAARPSRAAFVSGWSAPRIRSQPASVRSSSGIASAVRPAAR